MSMQRCCPPVKVADRDFAEEAALLKALADPHRLAIIATLASAEGEVCVCDFTEGLPLNQPTVSHHLRVLRDAGAVTCERRGTWVYYSLSATLSRRLGSLFKAVIPEKVRA